MVWWRVLAHFCHLITFKEGSSGDARLNFNAMKGRQSTLAKKQLYENELVIKLLRASF
jgi:hypothetical protein